MLVVSVKELKNTKYQSGARISCHHLLVSKKNFSFVIRFENCFKGVI